MVQMTSEQFKAAEIRGRARLKGPRAESAYYDADRDRIIVRLMSGIELGFAPAAVEGLQGASVEDLKTITIEGSGTGVHFPALDADLYVPALLDGMLGSRRWMAARSRTETMVAVFDTAAHAEAAIADLMAQGIPASSIESYAQSGAPLGGIGSGMTGQGTTGTTGQPRGLWAWLTGETASSGEHHALYDKTIETGGTVVTVISDAAQVDRIHAILEAHDPVDLDARHAQYGGSGAYGAMAAPASTGAMTGAATTGMTGAGTTEALTLSEEQLQVGKRAVDRGTTRVRRYVVERPVEEQIRLRDETVSVFRRPVAVGSTVGADAFTDRAITMNETDEEAVVAKTARVVEEVVVQKDVAERVETVRDTLRKEEVEIDKPSATTGGQGPGTKQVASPIYLG